MTALTPSAHRIARARYTIEGLAVGDAFGERFYVHPRVVRHLIAARALPAPPWPYSDDSEMALCVLTVLEQCGGIDQELLAAYLARHHTPSRGYDGAMRAVVQRLQQGQPWREARLYGEGNVGAALRALLVGVFFAEDLERVAAEALLAAEVTHGDGATAAAAVALALAATWAWRIGQDAAPPAATLLDLVLPLVPAGAISEGLRRARELPPNAQPLLAAATIESDAASTLEAAVPFALWCANARLGDFASALWAAVSGTQAVGSSCAIVGGLVAAMRGPTGIPFAWQQQCEPLPRCLFE